MMFLSIHSPYCWSVCSHESYGIYSLMCWSQRSIDAFRGHPLFHSLLSHLPLPPCSSLAYDLKWASNFTRIHNKLSTIILRNLFTMNTVKHHSVCSFFICSELSQSSLFSLPALIQNSSCTATPSRHTPKFVTAYPLQDASGTVTIRQFLNYPLSQLSVIPKLINDLQDGLARRL